MKTITYQDIKSWEPCYDPIKYIPKTWEGTAVDILKIDQIPFEDRLWCVLRTEVVSEKLMRLFAVWCYRQTLKFQPDQDKRSIDAADVAERYALGEATTDELKATESAAWSAAESAAESAARSASFAAWFAARSAARFAAWFAARSAARSAAWFAARSAAESAQRDKLIEMIEEENK